MIFYVDGSANPNPGQMGGGMVMVVEGKVVDERRIYLGTGTNNVAEYQSLIYCLGYMLSHHYEGEIKMDSALVVNQVNGT